MESDLSPEEIQAEAQRIDPYRYRRRTRALAAIALGAVSAGLVWVVLAAFDSARNPCIRVADYYCQQQRASFECETYQALAADSTSDSSEELRRNIKYQCQTLIERLAEDKGIDVP